MENENYSLNFEVILTYDMPCTEDDKFWNVESRDKQSESENNINFEW